MNSLDAHLQLLASAKAVAAVFNIYNDPGPHHVDTALDMAIRQLKASVAECEANP